MNSYTRDLRRVTYGALRGLRRLEHAKIYGDILANERRREHLYAHIEAILKILSLSPTSNESRYQKLIRRAERYESEVRTALSIGRRPNPKVLTAVLISHTDCLSARSPQIEFTNAAHAAWEELMLTSVMLWQHRRPVPLLNRIARKGYTVPPPALDLETIAVTDHPQ